MDSGNRSAPPLRPDPAAVPPAARWSVQALPSLLIADDPDEAKAVPQPAIKVHPARQAQAPEPSRIRQPQQVQQPQQVHQPQQPQQVQQTRQAHQVQPQPVQQSQRPLPPPAVIDPDDVKTAPQPAIRIPIPDAGPARPTPPGGQGQQAPAGTPRAAGDDEHGIVPGVYRRSPAAPLSWLRVIITTVRLWLDRRRTRHAGDASDRPAKQNTRMLPWIRAATLVLVVLLAAAGGVALSRNGQPGGKPTPQSNAVVTAQAARDNAAAWITGQVARNSIVSCDPVMCSVLEAHGYPAGNLDVLGPNAPDPLDSSVIVATDALRSQFGTRLTSVYAPVTLARFGTGSAEVDVRVVAPDGAPVYLRQLSADLAARKSLAALLLRDPKIAAEPAARNQLAAGLVDPRLLLTISTMSSLHPLSIVSFGDAGPGAAAGVPLREAVLSGGIGDSPADGGAGLAALASFLHGQQPPYLAAVIQTVRLATGEHALRVQFAAPTPLGLINGNQPGVGSRSR